MNIQIYGRDKCFDTKKAERYFKERKVTYQRIDIDRFGLSKGELNNVQKAVGIDNLLDKNCREFERLNLKYVVSGDTRQEMLMKHPKLYATPIVRNGRQATIGYQPEVWKDWE